MDLGFIFLGCLNRRVDGDFPRMRLASRVGIRLLGCLFLATATVLSRCGPVAGASRRHRLESDQTVSYVGAAPLSLCWSSYSALKPVKEKGRLAGVGVSKLVFWRDGVIWSRNQAYGWGVLQLLRRRSTLISITPRALREYSLKPKGTRLRLTLTAPAGFVLANYVVGIERSRRGLVAVALMGTNAPYFHPLASFEIKLLNPRNGTSVIAPLDGFPLGLGFDGDKLIVGTCAFPSSLESPMKKHFFLNTFSITRIHRKLALKRVSHERCAGPLQSFAGGKPVLVTVGGHRVFVGGANIRFGKKVGKIKQVVGEPGAVLVVKSDGSYGVAQKPRWIYRRLGSLRPGGLIGAGHNRAGFWLAQAGRHIGVVRITEIDAGGAVKTRTIKIFRHTVGQRPRASGGN